MNTARALVIACGLALAALIGLLLRPPIVVAVAAPATALDVETDSAPEAPEAEPDPAPSAPPALGVAPGPRRGDRRSDAELTASALSVLPADALATRVDVSIGALRRGELGAGLQACIGRLGAEPMAEARSRTGTDFLTAVERSTVTDGMAVIAGRFDGTRWSGLDVGTEERRGGRGRVFSGGQTSGETMAVYDDRLLIVSRDRETAMAALDRLERGDAPAREALAGPARGEIQGVLPAAGLLGEIPVGDGLRDGLREELSNRGARLEYSVSVVDGGLQVSARLVGAAGIEGVEALVTGLEAGLESVRMAAASSPPAGHDLIGNAVSQVLSRARLTREGGGFTFDLDVPPALLQDLLTQCAAPPADLTELTEVVEAPAEDDGTLESASFE
ncbi:hypothetical protein L6V77_26245 [Myxococcota bacterium]|nr:hypothetical protein [Myxococcota bacterium]